MSKTLDVIRKHAWISHVDDERGIGNAIIVTLKREWEFCSEGPGCGVKGFDTVADARSGCSRREVQLSATSITN